MIKDLIINNLRADGRNFLDYRNITIKFPYSPRDSKSGGKCVVSFGRTRVLSSISCVIVEPKPRYPSRGILDIFINSNLIKDENRRLRPKTERALLFQVLIKDFIREKIDLDALCICPKEKVFKLLISLKIENDDGNVLDCLVFAAIMSLKVFKRPELMTDDGGQIILHDDFVSLGLNALPIFVSFCIDPNSNNGIILDCNREEEDALDGQYVIMMTENGNCRYTCPMGNACWHEDGFVENCVEVIKEKVFALKGLMAEAMKVHDGRRKTVFVYSQSYLPPHPTVKKAVKKKENKTEGTDVAVVPEVDMEVNSEDDEWAAANLTR